MEIVGPKHPIYFPRYYLSSPHPWCNRNPISPHHHTLIFPHISPFAVSPFKMSLIEIDQEIFVLPSFTLECGATLRDVPVAYKTWGELNEKRDNVMIICHAFTGSSDVEDWCACFPHLFYPFVSSLSLFHLHPSYGCRLTDTQVGSYDGTQQSVRPESIFHPLRERRRLTLWHRFSRIDKPRH